jgi:hypothetical protein
MSEEILRAMMELFALIVKQDGGMLAERTRLRFSLPLKTASPPERR